MKKTNILGLLLISLLVLSACGKSKEPSNDEKQSTSESRKIASIKKKTSELSSMNKSAHEHTSQKADNSSATSSNAQTSIHTLSESVKKYDSNLSGANTYNDVLTLIIDNDAANSGVAGSERIQKSFLSSLTDDINHFKRNDLAKNGILITGAYIKTDAGTYIPTMTMYFDTNSLNTEDFSDAIREYSDDPTAILDKASNYYIFGMWLQQTSGKNLYDGVSLVQNDDAPDFFNQTYRSHEVIKPA